MKFSAKQHTKSDDAQSYNFSPASVDIAQNLPEQVIQLEHFDELVCNRFTFVLRKWTWNAAEKQCIATEDNF